MSRRKKGKDRRPKTPPEPVATGPEPDPPRPSRGLLYFAIVLAVVWVGALVVMAVFT